MVYINGPLSFSEWLVSIHLEILCTPSLELKEVMKISASTTLLDCEYLRVKSIFLSSH